MDLATTFLQSAIKRVAYYKELGDKTFAQLSEADFYFTPNKENNSIAVIIQHMAGNMLSRWTDFLTTDGEKEWRNRDTEFEEQPLTKQQLIELWEKGWNCFLGALRQLNGEDLLTTIYIRHEAILAVDAINRQLAHYPYHVGQIIYIGKMRKDQNWQSLSIPKGNSDQYNQQLFSANADKLKS
jgi:hypothetical protein